jgi:hypothetical protein
MIDLPIAPEAPQTIFDATKVTGRRIVIGPHCFRCTAGAGLSCGGATMS